MTHRTSQQLMNTDERGKEIAMIGIQENTREMIPAAPAGIRFLGPAPENPRYLLATPCHRYVILLVSGGDRTIKPVIRQVLGYRAKNQSS
jgi:hypothetical protein